jgi:small-conductance mechanosensitive channel
MSCPLFFSYGFGRLTPSRSFRRTPLILLCALTLSLIILSLPLHSRGAVNPITRAVGIQPAAQAPQPDAIELTDEGIVANRKNLESRLSELRLQLLPQSIAALQSTYHEGATPPELEEWERVTHRLAGVLENHVNTLIRLGSNRKANRDRAAEIKRWQGFTGKPPYPISLLDGLSDSIHGKEIDLKSLNVMSATAEGEIEEYSEALRNSSKQVRQAEENLETNQGKPGESRSRWLLTLARQRHALFEAGLLYGEVRRRMLDEAREGTRDEIDFLRRKLAAARVSYTFSREDLDRRLQEIDGRSEKLRRELDNASFNADESRKLIENGESAVRKAQGELAAGKIQKAYLDRLLREQERHQALFDAADFRVQILRGMIILLNKEQDIWRERYLIATGTAIPDRGRERKKNRSALEASAEWREYFSSKLSTLQSLIKNENEKLSNPSLADPERRETAALLGIYRDEESLLRRIESILSECRQLLMRLTEEEKVKREEVDTSDQIGAAMAAVSSLAGKAWNAELYVAEETIIADGKKIVRPRSVTVGKLVEAFLILLIGSWVIKRLKRLFPRVLTKRLRLGANDAQLCGRLLTYLMFIGLCIGTLFFVNIPLAVFAFLGGALAIGIGFGAQNLINNFISGLILMFDKTIRMGDVVEVDGQRGRVAAIGMRSSSIKRFDGIEMIVPNSLFLQQNVTNWTSSDKRVRYSVSIGVAYGSPTRKTEEVILNAVNDQPEVLADPAAYVVFDDFADSFLKFTACFWIELIPSVNTSVVFSDIRHRLGERLAEARIDLPFPQRDVHLDVGNPIEITVSRSERH